MRISSARIFSKSFGGKIKPGQTDVNKELTFRKKKTNRERKLILFIEHLEMLRFLSCVKSSCLNSTVQKLTLSSDSEAM